MKIVLCQMLLQQFVSTITSNIRNTGYTNDIINNHLCATLFAILYSKFAYINLRSNVCFKKGVAVFTNKAKNEQNIHKIKLQPN